METNNKLKIREIARRNGVAKTMDDMFIPNDVKPDEVVFRQGHIKYGSDDIKDCMMFHSNKTSSIGFNLVVMIRTIGEKEWQMATHMCDLNTFENEYVTPNLK